MPFQARLQFYQLSLPMMLAACALCGVAAIFLTIFGEAEVAQGLGIAAGIFGAFGLMFLMLWLCENGCWPPCGEAA